MYSVFRDLAIIILSAKFFALVARKCKAPQVVGEGVGHDESVSSGSRHGG